jgi:hypothetical protein
MRRYRRAHRIASSPARSSRISRAVWLLLAVLPLLFPSAAAAEVVQADLDGDGIRDQIVRGAAPSELAVRLSGSPQRRILHLSHKILEIVTADIDHDGDRDIIATTTGPGFEIFLNEGRGRFHAVHAGVAQHWDRRGIHVGPQAAGSDTDNPSDAAAGPVTSPGRSWIRPAPTALSCLLSTIVVPPFPAKGIDPRGPPSLLS